MDVKCPTLIHSASLDKTIVSYDLKAERCLKQHRTQNGQLTGLSQRKDRETELVSCGLNTPIEFWDIDIDEPVQSIDIYTRFLTCQVSPDGHYLAAGDDRGHLAIFDILKERFLAKYDGHTEQIAKLKWSGD